MKLNKFITSMIAGAMLMSSVNVMAKDVQVSVIAQASQMKKSLS